MNERPIFDNLKAEGFVKTAIKEGTLSHATLLITPDELLADSFALRTAKRLLGGCDACGECRSCKMIGANSHPDFAVYPNNETGKIKVVEMEEVISKSYYLPTASKCKVFLIKGLEKGKIDCQHKLLKLLEEPPENTYFILTVDNAEHALPTVRSRCMQIALDELSADVIQKAILPDCEDEEKAVTVAQSANGSLTAAYEILEKKSDVDAIDVAIRTIEALKSTKELVNAQKIAGAVKTEELLPLFALIYRDMLCLKNGAESEVSLKKYVERERELSVSYSQLALIESIDKVAAAISKLKFNANATSCLDAMLLELLEVKYNCPLS